MQLLACLSLLVNFLLEMIDGHTQLDGVVIVGATNYPDAIDAALLRPGRLDRHIRISLPDGEERKHLSRIYVGHHLSEGDVEAIAAATAGFAGAHFEKAGRVARRVARRAGRSVSIDDVMSILPAPKRISGGERRMVAVHEAGQRRRRSSTRQHQRTVAIGRDQWCSFSTSAAIGSTLSVICS